MTQTIFSFLDTSLRLLTIGEAPFLTHRKDQPYYMIIDSANVEWLVDSVLDHGRLMSLIRVGTDGKITKRITCRAYLNYKIILSEADFE